MPVMTATVATLNAILPSTLLPWAEVRTVCFRGEDGMVPDGSDFVAHLDKPNAGFRDLQIAVLMADLDERWGGADCQGWVVRVDHDGAVLTLTLTTEVFSLR